MKKKIFWLPLILLISETISQGRICIKTADIRKNEYHDYHGIYFMSKIQYYAKSEDNFKMAANFK